MPSAAEIVDPSATPDSTSPSSSSSYSGYVSDDSSWLIFSNRSSQRNGLGKKIDICKMKKDKSKNKPRRSKTKLLYNLYVGSGDCWTFFGSSDPYADSLDAPPSSPSCVVFNQLHFLLVLM